MRHEHVVSAVAIQVRKANAALVGQVDGDLDWPFREKTCIARARVDVNPGRVRLYEKIPNAVPG